MKYDWVLQSEKERSTFQKRGIACAKTHSCERRWFGVRSLGWPCGLKRSKIKLEIRLWKVCLHQGILSQFYRQWIIDRIPKQEAVLFRLLFKQITKGDMKDREQIYLSFCWKWMRTWAKALWMVRHGGWEAFVSKVKLLRFDDWHVEGEESVWKWPGDF